MDDYGAWTSPGIKKMPIARAAGAAGQMGINSWKKRAQKAMI